MQRKLPKRLNILLCGDDWRLKLAATVIALFCVLQISTTEAAIDQSLQAEYESAYQAVYDEPENYTHAGRFVIAAKRLESVLCKNFPANKHGMSVKSAVFTGQTATANHTGIF